MSMLEIRKLLSSLSEAEKERVETAIWLLDNEATSDISKIKFAFDLVNLINEIKDGRKQNTTNS